MAKTSPTVKAQTIVLVDDEHNILTALTIGLEAENYKIRTYPDGQAGLDGLANPTESR